MARPTRGAAWRLLIGISLLGLMLATATAGQASSLSPRARTLTGRSAERELISAGEADREGNEAADEVLGLAKQYADIRTLPAESVSARAMLQARLQAAGLDTTGGSWSELTNQPYNSDATGYRDPIFSNSGGGSGLVAGRIQALAVDGSTVYAGAADGGVWRSTDRGQHWTPVSDGLPSLSSGALAVDPETHDVWYGTGEAATSADGYLGAGVFESSDGGATWTRVGGDQLDGTLISAIVLDGRGRVYAATTKGLFRRSVSSPLSAAWERVLRPGTPGPYGFTFTNDVAVQPGTHGRVVIASLGWRTGPTDYSGFYVSHRSGDPGTWTRVHTTGRLRSNKIGRASFAYSADGSRLYALVESWQYALSKPSALYGIFVSESGRVSGPWKRIANWHTLANSGSALKSAGTSYAPGVQAWYNQAIGVDPHDPDHVYVGLEEVYETTDGGTSWHTIGPYWNFTIKCYKGGPEACPNTTHPDQHAVAFGKGVVYMGNDGGVYRRSLSDHARGGWTDLNNGLHTLQYYFAGAGRAIGRPVSGDMVWGGLQDNGVSLIVPGSSQMVSPFGGDGGDVYVDPANGDRAVVEYVLLDMALTTNGGESDGSAPAFREMTPSCYAFTYTPDPCDPNPRFIAPFVADPQAPNDHWVAGGQYVWETHRGWETTCSDTACDWQIVHDTGDGNTTTALGVNGETIYAAWCGGGCNPGVFTSGIDTNYGGTWHTVVGPDGNGGDPLPQRYITSVTVDPSDPAHVYVTYGGFSRKWIPGGGVGHVFESTDGGATWTDISGNLPDVPTDDLVLVDGHLVLAADVGVFAADASNPTDWSVLGTGLPNAAVNDLSVGPDGSYVLAATHGRGLWTIPTP